MSKSIKTTKTAAAPKKKTAVTKATAVTKKAVAASAPAPVKKPATRKKAPPKKKTAKASVTTITAKIDIDFGNTLYLRGEGPGLSWDAGVVMDCVAGDTWTASITGATAPILFKVLVNDLSWSAGEDYVVAPGSTIVIEPTFE